jgi:hypothetical protein
VSEQTFQTFVASERERLNSERETIFNQQHELEGKLSDINRELAAIDAYEAAKAGKPVRSGRPMATGQTRTRLASRGRRGSKRDALLKLIQESEGISRGEILEKMGLKGDKSGEMSVSNALTALTKANQVARHDGKYRAA